MSLMLGATTMLGDTGYDGPNNIITVVDLNSGNSQVGVEYVGSVLQGTIVPNVPKQGLWIDRISTQFTDSVSFALRTRTPAGDEGTENVTLATKYHVRSISLIGTFAGGAPDRTVTYVIGDNANFNFTLAPNGDLFWGGANIRTADDAFVIGNSYEVIIDYEEFIDFTLYAAANTGLTGFQRGLYGSIAPDLPVGEKTVRLCTGPTNALSLAMVEIPYDQDFLGAIALYGRFSDAPTVDQARSRPMVGGGTGWIPVSYLWTFATPLGLIAGNSYQVRIYLNG